MATKYFVLWFNIEKSKIHESEIKKRPGQLYELHVQYINVPLDNMLNFRLNQ